MDTRQLFKSQVLRFTTDMGVIVGFLTVCAALVSHFTELINSTKLFIIVLLALLSVIVRVYWKIKHPDKDAYGKPRYQYSEKQQAWALWTVIISSVLIAGTIGILLCINMPSNKIAVIITRFSPNVDPFGTCLIDSVRDKGNWSEKDTIEVKTSNVFLQGDDDDSKASLNNIFNSKNVRRGLLVFGSRGADNGKDFFKGFIYINGLPNLHINKNGLAMKLTNDNILHLSEDSLIRFAHDVEAGILARFILALLSFNAGETEASTTRLIQIKNDPKSGGLSSEITAHCNRWIAGGYMKSNVDSTIEACRWAIEADPTNPYLFNNLASLYYYEKKNADSAYGYFSKAHGLDSTFHNPITRPVVSLGVSASLHTPAPAATRKEGTVKIDAAPLPTTGTKPSGASEKKASTENNGPITSGAEKPGVGRQNQGLSAGTSGIISNTPNTSQLMKSNYEILLDEMESDAFQTLNSKSGQMEYKLMVTVPRKKELYIVGDDLVKLTQSGYMKVGLVIVENDFNWLIQNLHGRTIFRAEKAEQNGWRELFVGTNKVGDMVRMPRQK